ncbi:hypothetical protein GQ600_23108 [Phytophthora cactorum]|nr:hypothetical protein GQ600_23108 [Phytophthora cactorum]
MCQPISQDAETPLMRHGPEKRRAQLKPKPSHDVQSRSRSESRKLLGGAVTSPSQDQCEVRPREKIIRFSPKGSSAKSVLCLLRKKSPGAEEELPDKPAETKCHTTGGPETSNDASRSACNHDKRRGGSRQSSRSVDGTQQRALGVNRTISFPS